MSFKELMQFVLATIERRRLLVPIPFGLARTMASVLELPTGSLGIKPLLTPDQVELLLRDNVVSAEAEARRPHARGARHRAGGDARRRAHLSVALPQERPVQDRHGVRPRRLPALNARAPARSGRASRR